MKIKSWPLPPLREVYKEPEIPTEFRIFGIDYLNTNKIIPKDIPTVQFDPKAISSMVKDSYGKYLEILSDLNDENVEEIRKIHLEINEELNKSKEAEVDFELKRLKNEKNREINKMLEDLENEINKFEM
ncbi:hypothetical protein NGRA_1783 [Nosema granulosis]|uniref:Uncharacterized protein n=1 Tax=Nosema granulosis TaxID=83296 RepID=A0A9P6GYC0_9MICR|nr:hypothetical protein NGRA_1783 [Nosema granulosis]